MPKVTWQSKGWGWSLNPGLSDPRTWTLDLHTAHPGRSEHALAKMTMWFTPGQGNPRAPSTLGQMGHWPLLLWSGHPQPGHWVPPPEPGQQPPGRRSTQREETEQLVVSVNLLKEHSVFP